MTISGLNRRVIHVCVAVATTAVAAFVALGGGWRFFIAGADNSDITPAVSPDGTSVAFARVRSNGERDVYVAQFHGKPRRLTRSGGEWPAWSPDGSRIAFARLTQSELQWELWVVDADGSHLRRLTKASGGGGEGDLAPAWSPDGKAIAFEGNGDIRLINVDGSGNRLLVPDGGEPAWSPDGTKIAFIRPARRAFVGDLAVFDLEAKKTVLVAHSTRLSIQRPAWSPDGRKLAFEDVPADAPSARYAEVTKFDELYLLALDGRERKRLTDNSTFDGGPAWTPDGRIVFERSGRISVMSSDGTNVQRLF